MSPAADSRTYWRSIIRTVSGAIHLVGSDGRADDARAFAQADGEPYAEAHAGSDRHSDAEAFAGSDTAADAATYACAVA